MSTPYHACYFSHELTRLHPNEGVDRLSTALFDACVDLNPHQIEAALFALRSPLLKGVILADEVGLGKTIEAGLVLCQYWAERQRKLIVICPASLRKQWSLELAEKFNLPNLVLDATSYRRLQAQGNPDGLKVLVIWRNLSEQPEEDNLVLETWFTSKQGYSSLDKEFDLIYVNGGNNLENLKTALEPVKLWKLRLIEEDFQRLMFAGEGE